MHSKLGKSPSSFKDISSNYQIPKRFPTSATDTLNYLLKHGTDQQINFVFHLDGYIDTEILKKALRLSLDIEPVLGCNLIKESKRAYWERRDDLDHEDYFKIIEEGNLEKEMKNYVLGEIDPCKDPLIQIRIYRNKSDIMVIKSDHSVMDGGGFYDFLSLLLSLYNSLIENKEIILEPNISGSRCLSQVLKHYTIRKKMRSFFSENSSTPSWSFPAIGTGRKIKNFALKRFDKERFDVIKQYGKEHNATINDMILTAFFRAMFKLTHPKPGKEMRISMPTDLRVLLPEKKAETIANLVSSTFVGVKYYPDESFDKTLKQVSTNTKKKKEIFLGLGYMFLIRNIFRLRYSTIERLVKRFYKSLNKGKKWHPIVTNIGMLDSEKRYLGKTNIVDGYIIPPVNWAPSFSMGVSSFNKKLSLSIGYCEDSYSKESIEKFLKYIDEELP